MRFTQLKHSILKRKFKQSLLEAEKSRVTSQEEIKSVGIITTQEISSKVNLQKEIETALNVRNTKIYSYRPFNKKDEASYKHFSEKDINWKGKFTESSFQNFLEQPFDLLIGFYNEKNLYLENATLQSKATFKVGFANVNSSLYELEISENIENVTAFNLELRKYLSILNKLKN